MAKIVAISISKNKGEKKLSVNQAEFIADFGLKGDAHAGKWHRQVSLLSQESIDKINGRREKDIGAGEFAENITTIGITLHTLPVGTKLKIGDVILEITQIGKECHGDGCAVMQMLGDCAMPREGVFTRVLRSGVVRPGEKIEII